MDNVQADWIAARKDGRFAAALMNEDGNAIEVNVELGEEVTGTTASYGAMATVYDAAGQSRQVAINDGKLRVSIPARGLIGIVLDAPNVSAPAYADIQKDRLAAALLEGTVVETGPTADLGKGIVLQMDPNSYFAYVYTKFLPEQIQKAVLKWRIGEDPWQETENGTYPFEFTVPVREASQPFTYSVSILDKNNNWRTSPEHVLTPLDGAPPETSIAKQPEIPGGTNGWISSPVTVTLTANDNASGVMQTVYRVDKGTWTLYSKPFPLSEDGVHTVDYYSTDKEGNVEPQQSAVIKVDRTEPLLAIAPDDTVLSPPNHKMVPIHITVTDSDATSGVASVVLTSITSNEPDNGNGDGNASNDKASKGNPTMEFAVEVQSKKPSRALTLPKRVLRNLKKYRSMYLLLLPGLIYFTVFKYVPMTGIVIAFKDFIVSEGVFRSP